MFIFGCFNQNALEKKLDTWTNRLCCQEQYEKIIIQEFKKSENIITIKLDTITSDIRVEFSKREDKGYPLLEKILLKKSSESVIQLGKNLKLNLNDGNYRINLASQEACGEIVFAISKNKIIKKRFLCLEKN